MESQPALERSQKLEALKNSPGWEVLEEILKGRLARAFEIFIDSGTDLERTTAWAMAKSAYEILEEIDEEVSASEFARWDLERRNREAEARKAEERAPYVSRPGGRRTPGVL
jgi:hypothetical protein